MFVLGCIYIKIGQTEGAQEGNIHSQDQLSMGVLKNDILIDQY